MDENKISTPVAVARFSDHTCMSKEYITTETGGVRAFFNIESAKKFLQTAFNVPDEQLDWFMYDPVTTCADCNTPYLGDTVKLFTLVDRTVCEYCYYSS